MEPIKINVKVYKDNVISTIVDKQELPPKANVYKDNVISTIVDFYSQR